MKLAKKQRFTTIAAFTLAASISTAHAASATSENTKEFLSDPHRVGTLAGSILGGVLTAHPAGTVAGSILGYVFGKTSAFKSQEGVKATQQARYARSIIPKTEEIAVASVPEEIAPIDKSPDIMGELATIKDILNGMAEKKAAEEAQQRPTNAASLCYGNQGKLSDPRLMSICYYHQSSS